MDNGIHFISGLPRSGSTLLAALLSQNPAIHAAMSSPAASLVASLMRTMSQENEGAVFIDDGQRERVLKACIDGFYGDIHPEKLVIDTSRDWTAKLSLAARLWPASRVICCVRNPAWVLDSLERLTQKNNLEPSGIFKFDPGGNVYTRCEGLMAGGMVGFALSALRQAVFSDHADRLLLVRFDTLTRDPHGALAAIYDFIGQPRFAHDAEAVEQDYNALMFDARIGAPGLHHVRRRVRQVARRPILPPDLFERHQAEAFWETAGGLPPAVRMI